MRYLLIFLASLLLVGCANFSPSNSPLTPGQLESLAKNKNIAVLCTAVSAPLNHWVLLSLTLEQGVIYSGSVVASSECEVKIVAAPKPSSAASAP